MKTILLLADVSSKMDPTDYIGFTFFVGSMAMMAASAFFFLSLNQFDSKWRTSILVSGLITFIASQFNIPIYICGITFKFDPMTLTGTDTEIEERAYSEVWDKKPKKLKILNPAFERIDPNLIDGYICEFGVVSPSEIYKILQEKEPWMFQ